MQQSAQIKYSSQEDEIAFQNLVFWRRNCKQFIISSLETIIQSREASLIQSQSTSFLKKFGLKVQNMNELDMLLSSFDALNLQSPDEQSTPNGGLSVQDLILDITYKSEGLEPVLVERWSFTVALNPRANKKSLLNSSRNPNDKSSSLQGNYYKKMCVYLRSMKALTLALPAFKLPQKLRSEQTLGLFKNLKTDYQMKLDREQVSLDFPFISQTQRAQPTQTNVVQLETSLGELVVEIQYIKKNEVEQAFRHLQLEKERIDNAPKPATIPFAQFLRNALGPENPPAAQTCQVQQHKPRANTSKGLINDQSRFRANSDNTYQKISSRGFAGMPQPHLNIQSPRPSEGILIKEDYFTAEKNKLYYKISTKNSGHSYSSELSNVSSVKGTSPFIPQVNLPTQGSSTLLKSSLEGGILGNYDSNDVGSNKARLDHIRKLEQVNNSRNNRNFRLSFDENIKNNPATQRSFSSFYNQNNPGGSNIKHETNSIGIDFSSLPVQHQLIEEEKDDYDFINKDSPTLRNQRPNKEERPSNHGQLRLSSSMEPIDSTVKISAALERRQSICSNDSGTLFSINERKKYIGFLEEGISDADEDQDSSTEEPDREDQLNAFLIMIEKNKTSPKKFDKLTQQQEYQRNAFQNELRKGFFQIQEMRQIMNQRQVQQQRLNQQIEAQGAHRKLTLTRSVMNFSQMAAARGGGHFHKPDPKVLPEYQHTRLIHLEDINTILYHDYAPEYHMHLHSPQIKSGKHGWSLLFIYFCLVIAPVWFLGQKINRYIGTMLYPSVRPGKDHAQMAPALIYHLNANNYENKQDALGRRTGQFYKNGVRQSMEYEMKPTNVIALESHGFKF